MNNDIAIVGMAGRFSDAPDIDSLFYNLKSNKNSIKKISKERLKSTALPLGREYFKCAYLEDVDKFDFNFFRISKSEADAMCPSQRILLEVVYETLNNAAYPIKALSGRKISVFCSAGKSKYSDHFKKRNLLSLTGGTGPFLISKITNFFNWKGSAFMIDTTCSSGLTSLHLACNELLLNQADYSLVCGVNLSLFPFLESNDNGLDVWSSDGISRAFHSSSKGMSRGESAISILLKPLDKAIKDRDTIHAVIKSTAVNNNANKTISPTEPSSKAQSEVIMEAWKRAGINPLDIGFIEAHGSGTRLGDALEIESLNIAFKKFTNKKKICPISSVKSNIGHGLSCAGLSGLVKAILSLKYKTIFPNSYYEEHDCCVDFEESAVFVNKKEMSWDKKKTKNFVGVTSVGISGVNSHVVLGEAPSLKYKNQRSKTSLPSLIIFSAKSPKSLKLNLKENYKFLLKKDDINIADLSYTLGVGRSHYQYRYAVIANDIGELKGKIKTGIENGVSRQNTKELKKIIFVFSDCRRISNKTINYFISNFKVFKEKYRECEKIHKKALNNKAKCFSFQYSLYFLLLDLGINTEYITGVGAGKIVCDVLMRKKTLSNALFDISKVKAQIEDDVDRRVNEMIEKQDSNERIAFINMSLDDFLINKIKEKSLNYNYIYCYFLDVTSLKKYDFINKLFKFLYLLNYNIDWNVFYNKFTGNRIELPAYQFEKKRCWAGEVPREGVKGKIVNKEKKENCAVEKKYNTEFIVKNIYSLVLGVSEVSAQDNFFDLGGHSLMANQILNRIKKELKINLSFEDIFNNPTAEKLAKIIKEQTKTKLLEIKPVKNRNSYILSHSQERMFIMYKLEPNSSFYNVSIVRQIKGDLNIEKFIKALETIIKRHESLRTNFKEVKGSLIQEISPEINVAIKVIDFTKKLKKTIKTSKQDIIRKLSRTPFRLEDEPLLRINIVKEKIKKHDPKKNQYTFIMVVHHIVFDTWSFDIFNKELAEIYNAFLENKKPNLPSLSIQYKDYAEWEQSRENTKRLKIQEKYWLKELSGELSILNIPTDRPRPPVQTFDGNTKKIVIEKEIAEKIKKLSKKSNTTLFVFLFSIYNVFLNRVTNQNDLIVGTPSIDRNNVKTENNIGLFVNTLAIRTKIKNNQTFDELLSVVRDNFLSALKNKDYPFEQLVKKINPERDMSRNPIFSTMFQLFQSNSIELINKNKLSKVCFEPVKSLQNITKFDLSMRAFEEVDGSIVLKSEYNTNLFNGDTMNKFLNAIKALIINIVKNPKKKIIEFKIISKKDEHRLLYEFNKNKVDYSKNKTIHQLFEEQVKRTPNNIAVEFEGEILTYKELNEKANQLAHYLRDKKKIKINDVIGIMIERSLEMIIGVFAILKAGGTYLPIDHEYPEERIKYILKDSGANILLTNSELLKEKKNIKLKYKRRDKKNITIEIDRIGDKIKNCSNKNLNFTSNANNTVYLIYTSGSTGNPKGVLLYHKNLVNLVEHHIKKTNIDFSKVLQYASISFDVSAQEIFTTLLSGGKLFLISSLVKTDINLVLDIVRLKLIPTVFFPTELVNFIATEKNILNRIPESMNHLLVAGSRLKVTKEIMSICQEKNIVLYNQYGPTETHVVSSLSLAPGKGYQECPSIGVPTSNNKIYIFGKNRELVPELFPGELCIGGDQVGAGYKGNVMLTSKKYVKNKYSEGKIFKTGDKARWLKNGEIEFLGRFDSQINLRGYRIAPEEIENKCKNFENIKQVIVKVVSLENKRFVKRTNLENKYLVVYYLTENKKEIDINKIKNYLKKFLPEYMIPSFFVFLDKIPINKNGKLDDKLLPSVDARRLTKVEYKNPNTQEERQLEEIWKELLVVEKISLNDCFFDLGGHSLLVIKLYARIRETFKNGLAVQELFENRIFCDMVNAIKQKNQIMLKQNIINKVKF